MRVLSAGRARAVPCVLACLLLAACTSNPSLEVDDGRLQVVVSVLPQAYFVEQIGGDLVRVEVLIPKGASPTSFEPSFAQLKAVDEARLYVKVGHPHFPFEQSSLKQLLAGKEDLLFVSIVQDHDHAGAPHDHGDDPHVWLAPSRVAVLALHIHEVLAALMPEHRQALDTNLAAFLKEIETLDEELHALFAGDEGKRFFVFHPAWGTFAREYGLEQLAVEAHGKQPDVRSFSGLVETAKSAGVDVLFAEPQGDPQQALFVARAMGARVVTLDPLARDWTANMRTAAALIKDALR